MSCSGEDDKKKKKKRSKNEMLKVMMVAVSVITYIHSYTHV